MTVERVKEVAWSEITPDEKNANRGTKRGRDLHEKSLRRTGAGRSIVLDRDGRIIAGNKTAEIAQELGLEIAVVETHGDTLIAVQRMDLDLEDDQGLAREMAYADNRVAQENLAWAEEVIKADVEAGVGAVTEYWFPTELVQMGIDAVDPFAGVTGEGYENPYGTEDPDIEIPPTPDPDAAITQPGDLIQLGRHLLLCGDAEDEGCWGRLMSMTDEKARLVFTDPPYGVDVAAKNRFLDRMQRGNSNRVTTDLEGDDRDDREGLERLLAASFRHLLEHTEPGSVWFVCGPSGDNLWRFSKALTDIGVLRQTIAWVKQNATFAPLGVDFHWRWEPIFYGWTPGAAHRFYGDRTQDTLWEFDRPTKSPEHPTMKPVELVTHALRLASEVGDLVLDPFLGAGSTIISGEAEGRTVYGMEIDPGYCDVIVTRWESYTGETAERP
jgi:DNA modification methylase